MVFRVQPQVSKRFEDKNATRTNEINFFGGHFSSIKGIKNLLKQK